MEYNLSICSNAPDSFFTINKSCLRGKKRVKEKKKEREKKEGSRKEYLFYIRPQTLKVSHSIGNNRIYTVDIDYPAEYDK